MHFTMEKKLLKVILETKNKKINKKEEIKPKDSGEMLGKPSSLWLNMKVNHSPKKLEVIYFTMEKKLLKVILETKNKMINKKEEIKPKDSGEMHGKPLSLWLNMKVKHSPKKLEVMHFTMENMLLKI